MRKSLILMLAALLLAAVPAIAAQKAKSAGAASAEAAKIEAPVAKAKILTMTIGDPEDSEMGLLGIAFKNYVQQASNNMLELKLSYSGGLDADETYQFHRTQTGKLDLALGGVGNLAPMVRHLGVVTLPYLFPDTEAVIKGTTGKAAELLNSYAEKAGIRILAWTYYGYRYISNSRRPIKSLEDMKGLRIRVPQSLVMIKTYRAFGAIPVPLAWPATRSALKNDLVDGQCYDYNGFRTMKFRDVGQKYIAEIHYLYNLQPLVINLKIFNSLSPAEQKVLIDAGQHVQNLSMQYQKEMNTLAKRVLMQEGVHISTVEDEDLWRQKAIDLVWPEAEDSIGGVKAINEYLKASGLPAWNPTQKAEMREKMEQERDKRQLSKQETEKK